MNFEDYESLEGDGPAGRISSTTHMTAGAIAGIMEHCVMYPLDSVKTRMQSLRVANNTTITETFRYMVRKEGLLRPIRGMSAVVAGAGPAHAFYFATYERSKYTLGQLTRHRHEHLVHGFSGCLASLVHDAVSNPAEVVKQRLQMYNSPYRSAIDCMRRVYRTEGMRAFYRSYITQIAMNVPFQTLHFMTYEFCQSLLNPTKSYDPLAHAICGAVAGAVAAGVTTPLDVCKTVLNTQEATARANGLVEAAAQVMRATGPLGFFKGIQARVLYQMPAAAICWSTYETLKFLLTRPQLEPELRLVLPKASVCAEEARRRQEAATSHIDGKSDSKTDSKTDSRSIRSMELPAVSGAELYGALSLNTLHQGDVQAPSFTHNT